MRLTPERNASKSARLSPESHSSLNVSMEDFEVSDSALTLAEMSPQLSEYRERDELEQDEDARSIVSGIQTPPPWRRHRTDWLEGTEFPFLPQSIRETSYESSPELEGDSADVKAFRYARRLPLPESPAKGVSPNYSPGPDLYASAVGYMAAGVAAEHEDSRWEQNEEDFTVHGVVASTEEQQIRSDRPQPAQSWGQELVPMMKGGNGAGDGKRKHERAQAGATGDGSESDMPQSPQENYIRFSTSLHVLQRTEPIEAAITFARKSVDHFSTSTYRLFFYALVTLLAWRSATSIFAVPTVEGPAPDLIKVAGMAKTFEEIIFYSEQGYDQIFQLQDTGVAVWDLSASMGNSNVSSAKTIASQLDELSEHLNFLVVELTDFFASVDSDIDTILMTMDWARRELHSLANASPGAFYSAWSNVHGLMVRQGLVGDHPFLAQLFGPTYQQRSRATLESTFTGFLNVLEESINNEINWSNKLFTMFSSIDKQCLLVQRTVIQEQDLQEKMHSDFLSSLWTLVIGPNAPRVHKFEKNKALLSMIRERTTRNKSVLSNHRQQLMQLRTNLEHLRRKLVSPLLRNGNVSVLSLGEQIEGLTSTYVGMKDSRDSQKMKMREVMWRRGGPRRSAPEAAASPSAIMG